MKSFNPFQLTNIQETQPTIRKRGLYLKEKMHVEKRYRKKHEIRNYKDFLGVNAITLEKLTLNTQRPMVSTVTRKKPNPLPRTTSKPALAKSQSEFAITLKSKPFVRKKTKHKESPKVSHRIKPPVLVSYTVGNTDEQEPIPCEQELPIEPVILKRPVIKVKPSYKFIQDQV